MSAIAGALRLDGGPIDPALLQALATTAPGNVVDDLAFWHDGAVGLACALARVTPESRNERQPLVDPASGCVIVFDGRLDNAGGVAGYRGCEISGLPPRDPATPRPRCGHSTGGETDAAIALAAYLQWGTSAPEHLVGDFAFAIWDSRARRLLLANDPVAMRPLFFSTLGDRLTFASTLEQLLRDPLLPRDFDEQWLLTYLYPDDALPTPQTIYRHVQLLPGGHCLVVEGSRVELRRYWNWREAPPEPRRATDADVDEFRSIFAEAVRCRLRSTAPVGLALSGGLDSGAIASMAGWLHRNEGAPEIRAYSWVLDDFPECDERRYSQAASSMYGFPHACIPADECWTLSRFEEWRPVFTDPHFGTYEDAWYRTLEQARADGVRAMLTGDGGDFFVAGSPTYLADWLLQGRWGAMMRELRARTARSGQSTIRSFAPIVYTLLPMAVQRRLERRGLADLDSWIPPRLRGKHHTHMRAPAYRGRHAWWYQLRELLTQFAFGYHNSFKDRQLRRFGLEVRQPFFDVRLIDFTLRTPPDAFYRNGMTKFALRQALRDILPPAIRDRRDKADFGPMAHRGLRERRRAFVESLMEDSELERRGYIVPAPWKAYIGHYLQNGGPAYWAVWRTLTTEMWLRHREGRLPALQ